MAMALALAMAMAMALAMALVALAMACEALDLIALDNIYVGENGWKDEHFLDVKQAREALAKIRGKEG